MRSLAVCTVASRRCDDDDGGGYDDDDDTNWTFNVKINAALGMFGIYSSLIKLNPPD
jgi:hypothetical protein